jgi:hypothetical protein
VSQECVELFHNKPNQGQTGERKESWVWRRDPFSLPAEKMEDPLHGGGLTGGAARSSLKPDKGISVGSGAQLQLKDGASLSTTY